MQVHCLLSGVWIQFLDFRIAKVSNATCYEVTVVDETFSGLRAELRLLGEPCNAFGNDIQNLTLEVSFETKERLHLHIYDSAGEQFQIPESVFPTPKDPNPYEKSNHSLKFSYKPNPFAFWISRSESGEIVFDTRGTRLIFEDQATIQTMWARDSPNHIDVNLYGNHPVYFEHRIDADNTKGDGKSHAVFLKNSHGMDVKLNPGLISYSIIGGTLDLYFLSGPTPISAIEQYVQLVGLPTMQPYWAFGFHICRWGTERKLIISVTKQTRKMREANIPLEVQWNDNFQVANKSQRFPIKALKEFISELHQNHQYYVPIVDSAIHVVDQSNSSDVYDVYTRGSKMDVFIKNPDGSEYIGQVWPGYTVFPDWFAKNSKKWWKSCLKEFKETQVDFDGLLDMNEPSSFCDGSCGTGANLSNYNVGDKIPTVESQRAFYPENYDTKIQGFSGNLSKSTNSKNSSLSRRSSYKVRIPDSKLNQPAYAIHNEGGPLTAQTLSVNATHQNGWKVYSTHNLWGHMEETITYDILREIIPNRRPFLISRSTFSGGGRVTGHWLGDNNSTWYSMRTSIQGVIQFQAFGIPMVGPDTCGLIGNSDEELCNRWMMLSSFYPFFRNHNNKNAISQEPYVWDSVADASRKALANRHRLLPYLYSGMAQASLSGTPFIRALFWEFPNDSSLLDNSDQFMFGHSIIVTPVLKPGFTTVEGFFPGIETWRDLDNYEVMKDSPSNKKVLLDAPLSKINAHIRGGSILLRHSQPGYTTFETRNSPYDIVVSPNIVKRVETEFYVDDGITPQANFAHLKIKLFVAPFHISQPLSKITILGNTTIYEAKLNGNPVNQTIKQIYGPISKTIVAWEIDELMIDLNLDWKFEWS
ncbi:glycosyl hydrolases family 31-domain-containing protein [Phakopsora pachyrhizi]|uniref:Glycosyl hydrolases family 31-domain-containing protein n=1 Tax=Phakopsora pachyrhizi TaxID=170000 RepID=A0AAV0BR14_PHAPC|nr:glycosyl hydrolases family 31-domain-containing protein [Phakopsora pachyrhizi]